MARTIRYDRYDASPNLRKLTRILKAVVDQSQLPDPDRQRSRALDLFLDRIRPSEKSRLNDPNVELLKFQFTREMRLYWFEHAYADLLRKRAISKEAVGRKKKAKPRSSRAASAAGQGP